MLITLTFFFSPLLEQQWPPFLPSQLLPPSPISPLLSLQHSPSLSSSCCLCHRENAIDKSGYKEIQLVKETKELVARLCKQFYDLGQVLGINGVKVHNLNIPLFEKLIFMALSIRTSIWWGTHLIDWMWAVGMIGLVVNEWPSRFLGKEWRRRGCLPKGICLHL